MNRGIFPPELHNCMPKKFNFVNPIIYTCIYMIKQITEKVSWVGKVDWELVRFHGDEYSTHKGSSYNSYLIRDEKVALIDTVWLPYDREFVSNLKQNVNLHDIDYIIMQHNEIDHSGALMELLDEIPDTPIYCTKKGEQIIRGHYHKDWNFVNVKTGDQLCLGQSTLTFIEAPMLHWPDTMFTYMDEGHILFSNDGFGQHFASESLYNSDVNQEELMYEAEKYYANILCPFSQMVSRKIQQILSMNLPIDLICPSHGIIWKDNPSQIVEKYVAWSDAYQENQITIVYDTMWQSTRLMAQAIADGIREADSEIKVKLMNITHDDKNDVLTECFHSSAVLVGSPTINNGYSFAIAGILEMMQGLKFKKKKAASFGSYGWSGEAVKKINAHLENCGFELLNDGMTCLWVPEADTLDKCREFGRNIFESIHSPIN